MGALRSEDETKVADGVMMARLCVDMSERKLAIKSSGITPLTEWDSTNGYTHPLKVRHCTLFTGGRRGEWYFLYVAVTCTWCAMLLLRHD